MLRKRMKRYNNEALSWEDLRCTLCNSPIVIKCEDKASCSNPSCKESPEDCKIRVCDKSQSWVTGNTIQKKFICRECGNTWTEFKRVI
jgi:hypothetical protein